MVPIGLHGDNRVMIRLAVTTPSPLLAIARRRRPWSLGSQNQALQQTKTLSCWSREDFTIGPVRRQALTVGEELFAADIAGMVIRNDDAPLILRHAAGPSADLAGRPNLLASLVSPEHVGAGVRWIAPAYRQRRNVLRSAERGRRPWASAAPPPSAAHFSTLRRDWSPNIGVLRSSSSIGMLFRRRQYTAEVP
jgi:hypothetical protein